MTRRTRAPMVFGGAAVTLVGSLGGAVAMPGVAGAAPEVWAHNTTAIQVSIVRTTTSPSTFKGRMTNHEGSSETGKLCIEFYTVTPTNPTQLKLESFFCTRTATVATNASADTVWLPNDDWVVVEARWKVGTQTISHVESLTFSV